MELRLFLAAFVGHFLLVVVLYALLTVIRMRDVRAGATRVSDYVREDGDGPVADRIRRNIANQFELPMFAYFAAAVLVVLGAIGWFDVAAAWLLLVGRVAHTLVQTLTRERDASRSDLCGDRHRHVPAHGTCGLDRTGAWIDMKPAGRLSASIEVLTQILERHRPASEALNDWGKAHRFAGSGDRAAIGNLVYDALRRKASAAAQLGADTPRAIALATASIAWDMGVEDVIALADGSEHAPSPITDEERAGLTARVLAGVPDHALADVPAWAWPSFVRAFGADAMAAGRAMAERAPADLRVNTLKSTVEKVEKSLKPFEPERMSLSPTGLRVPAPRGPGRTPNLLVEAAFHAGWFEIQDEGSQIAARLAYATHPKAGQVLDLCAGGGGKSLALAALKENRGQIHAYDNDKHRLAPIHQRLKRAGARNVQVHAPRPGVLDDLKGRIDLVLVDAPCSGTGTWRRRPDSKWRLSPEALQRRIAEQALILDEAIAFVRPGGALVYVTCSVLPEENGDQIDALLARHPSFTPIDLAALWPEISAAPPPEGLAGGRLQLSPHRDGTDGFFVAGLRLAK